MRIGVLALQGAFIEHRQMLTRLGVDSFEIRQQRDLLMPMDGVILPGGESTTMGKLLRELNMQNALQSYIREGLPALGTCAGMILLASQTDDGYPTHLATMDIVVARNAYGRQLGSFNTKAAYNCGPAIHMPFIRAPYIKAVGDGVDVLAVVDQRVVAARQNNQLAVAFHPELTSDTAVHEHLLELIRQRSIN